MIKCLFYLGALFASVYGSGEFTVLTYPESVVFKGHDHIKQCLLKEIYSAALGFTTEQDSNWQGMYMLDPFNLARAVVTVFVDGVADIGEAKGHHFPLKTDEDESDTYDAMVRRMEDRYPYGGSQFVRVELNLGQYGLDGIDMFNGVKEAKPKKTINLKLSVEEDLQFLEELGLLIEIIKKIESTPPKKEVSADIFWFKVSALHAVSDLHGENSTAVKEAKQLLVEAVERLNAAFNRMYSGRVLVNVITSDASHTRRVRRDATDPAEDFDSYNLAKSYSADYPIIFNIILWFGVIMVFSLLAITLFIGNMDPGRDSIIYRMTSTRMKKDN